MTARTGQLLDALRRSKLDPIYPTDILFERIEGNGGSNFGIRVDHQRGGRIVDCVARGYRRGFYIDEQVDGLTLVVRPQAGRQLCRQAIARYLEDDGIARYRRELAHQRAQVWSALADQMRNLAEGLDQGYLE